MTVELSPKRKPRKAHEPSPLGAVRAVVALWFVIATPIALADLPVTGGVWVSQGPSPIRNGQVEGIENGPVIGAVQDIVAHPSNADIVWIGAANGGVWKTTNATATSPAWTPMGDTFASLSIGALTLDPTDGTHNTLVAGFGRFSNFPWEGGARNGLLRTTNGGTNWTALTPALLIGKNISGLAARGATIVAAVNLADSFVCGNIGIFRSTDTGASFTMLSGAVGSGLPMGRTYDLAADPTNDAVLYAAIAAGDAPGCSGTNNGIYKSTDTGATWSKVSDATIDALFTDAAIENAKIAVGSSGEVYAGIVNDGQLAGLFRSGNGGSSWTQLDTPSTNEGGTIIGMHPAEEGERYFSIVADPNDASIVYVGGDRQPLEGDGLASTPNSIGATDYSGRLFRVNSGAGTGIQSTPLTHCLLATVECNGTLSTENNSAPHAGSRRMVFDAGGNLLEGDDGGLYRRTNPGATGDWLSLIGNLRVTEVHNIAYDRVSNTIITGNQDTGTSEQTIAGGTAWRQVAGGTGGDVAVDDVSSGTQSTRYSSDAYLGSFTRRIMNDSGAMASQAFPALTVVGGGPAFVPQYVTPVELNAVDPMRLLFGGANDLYESTDRGDTITALSFNVPVTAMVYGGKSGADNPEVIYALSGAHVYLRTGGSGAPVQTPTSPGGTLRDIAIDPEAWQKAYVINDAGQVFWRASVGSGWNNITGNLAGGTTDLRTIAFVPGSASAIVVGGAEGVFRMATDNPGVWSQLGTGLTNAPVWDMDYDETDDTLVVATMGRGVWKLTPVTNLGPVLSINDVTITEGNLATTVATFNVTLTPASTETVTVSYATIDGSATAASNDFSSDSPIDIPASGEATPYPSTIVVAGAQGTITKVTATLHGFGHPWTADVDILLVGPEGQSVVLMSDVGGEGNSVSGLELIIDDDAIHDIPGSFFGSGMYEPTNIADGEGVDAYPSPAPSGGYGSTMSVFNGTAPNGAWSLYVVDDTAPDGGLLSGGWTLSLSTSAGDYLATTGFLTFEPGQTTQPIEVTVLGDTIDESDENFFIHLSEAFNAVLQDDQGEGTIADNDTVLIAPANVVATATTSTSVNISWTAAAGAASYRVYRSNGGAYTLVGSPAGTSFDDTTVVANTAYLYRVRSFAGSESTDSNNTDLATTFIFTDPTLTVGTTTTKLAHFTELLTAVNAVRTLASLGTVSFTLPVPTTSVTIRRQHLLDLRTALDGARAILGLTALTYTDPTVTAGTTTIKAVHITEIRDGVK
jgi:hypothetical protein